MKTSTLFYLVVVFLSSSTFGAPGPLIVGGVLSPHLSFVAAIQHNGHPHCSASWIGEDILLTAAHCQPDPSSMSGWAVVDTFGQSHTPDLWIVNKDYDESILGMHDTMLIRVRHLAPAKPHDTLLLPESDGFIPEALISAGYGRQITGDNSPVSLRSVRLTQEDCNEAYPGIDVPDANICYNSPLPAPAGTCSGDSGGPLYDPSTKMIYGVTSWGAVPCASRASVFVDVQQHLDWLERAVIFAEQR